MKYNNCICIDAGTPNCPCPLAETGDCLVCSRLNGRDKCDCSWCGLCIYNEFMQNDRRSAGRRERFEAPVLSRRWYSSDLMTIKIKVDRGFTLAGAGPGSFVFLSGSAEPFFDTPVSIMRTDTKEGTMTFAVKMISAKTKAIAQAEDKVYIRGVYRNGLLGEGLRQDAKGAPLQEEKLSASGPRWLFITKGAGFAPAVNIIDRLPEEVSADMVIDTEKITEEMISDSLSRCEAAREGRVKMDIMPLSRLLDRQDIEAGKCIREIEEYEKVFILASDHYIHTLSAELNVPAGKLVYANNFHMCCGEGVCGACCHVDENGNVSKMCKCRRRKDL